jgi:two-component system, OmpR family, sensor kinase
MRSRMRTRAAAATLIAAVLGAAWLALSAAVLPQPPAVREVLLGAGVVCLCLFVIIGGLAIIEARALRHAELRMRRFLADASHELRTPIAGIQASAETLLRTNPSRAAREELILQILREGHRAGRLIDDLLAITRLEQGTPLAAEPFDLIPLTTAAVELTRELAPAVDVQLHGPGHVHLHGDPQRIRQILDNLLCNARHATPDGGQITVQVTDHTDTIQVEVTDTGPGIPPPDRERIFERFTRLNGTYPRGTGGNGLGLAIARSIATAHSGTLTCAGPAGPGARFQLRLPR